MTSFAAKQSGGSPQQPDRHDENTTILEPPIHDLGQAFDDPERPTG